ncbi:LysR family transcriptional regulator [Actinospica durhamensis]|uniref:LysR family transcriptional regulator n=1 Tax=Actinospica durhamensis TaxID=1508375 RepID=A0A941EW51_9ACTN|nr:LysR family transcriptional regulator [Actinospica durhamensis]MBR7838388.1 LysR family transcriptional regulator [Actinospica durhamensis]
MELRDIEIFLALAEELHFGRTAELLHVSPARVSQAIKKQERAIGAELFVRTSRNVRLTPVGERLRDELAAGYRQIQEAIAGAAAAARCVSGVVRIGFASPWCGDLVVKAADVFRQRHPACEVQIIERLLADRFGPLRTRELDLQLTELPAEEPDIVVGPILFREPRALMMSVDHPLARNQTVSIEDYGDCVVIGVASVPDYFRDFHLPLRTPSGRPITHGRLAASFQEAQSLIGADKGVQPSTVRAALYHARPDIVFVPFRDAPTVDYGVTWLTDGDSVKIHAFTQALLDVASGK